MLMVVGQCRIRSRMGLLPPLLSQHLDLPELLAAQGRSSVLSSTSCPSPQHMGREVFNDHGWGLLGDP